MTAPGDRAATVGQVRGASTDAPVARDQGAEREFLSLQQVSQITSLSVRTLRRYIRGVVEPRLPAFRIAGGKFLVHRDELRAWLQHFRYRGGSVEALVAKIRDGKRRTKKGA